MNYISNLTEKFILLENELIFLLSLFNKVENQIILNSFFEGNDLMEGDDTFGILLLLLSMLKLLIIVWFQRLRVLLKTYLLISLIDYFSIKIDTIIYLIKILIFTLTNIFLISD